MAEIPGPASWMPMHAVVSKSGDLGYTYGVGGAFSYLRIWKKAEGKWAIVLDLASPIPPEPKK